MRQAILKYRKYLTLKESPTQPNRKCCRLGLNEPVHGGSGKWTKSDTHNIAVNIHVVKIRAFESVQYYFRRNS